jgi:polysaccharide export outer membrane protein
VRVFYGAQELKQAYTIDAGGVIALPYIGEVNALGRTQVQLKDEIQTRLGDGYLIDPVVSIELVERLSKKISVIGEVKSPQTMIFYEGMTIVEAVSQAGGFTPLARKDDVRVTRVEGGEKRTYTVPVEEIARNRATMFVLLPGDVVFVPERRW